MKENAEGTQRARRGFADFASEFFATFALKRGVRACFNAKSAKGGARRGFALRFSPTSLRSDSIRACDSPRRGEVARLPKECLRAVKGCCFPDLKPLIFRRFRA